MSGHADTIRKGLKLTPLDHEPEFQDALVALDALLAENQRWLAWSGGRYPDDSPGDVITAYADGTILLDDGIITWNPLRALEWIHDHPGYPEGKLKSIEYGSFGNIVKIEWYEPEPDEEALASDGE